MKNLSIFLIVLLLSGCSTWSKVETPRITAENKSFSIAAPNDWLRASFLNTKKSITTTKGDNKSVDVDRIVLTRDGLTLQTIDVCRLPSTDAFPHIGKKATETKLVSELADLFVADLKGGEGLSNLDVLEISPDSIAGHKGFRLRVQYKNDRGLTFERLVFAFVKGEGFYYLSYQAPRIHYFKQYQRDFESVVNSFELSGSKKKS